jgi:hypothetical protein
LWFLGRKAPCVEKRERRPINRDIARRADAFLLATGIVAASCFAALVGLLWGSELKCDDSCSIGGGWLAIVLLLLGGAAAIALTPPRTEAE